MDEGCEKVVHARFHILSQQPENLSQDEIFNEVGDYFHAWMNTCNHDEWANNPSLKKMGFSERNQSVNVGTGYSIPDPSLYIRENNPPPGIQGKRAPHFSSDLRRGTQTMKFVDPLDDTYSLDSPVARGLLEAIRPLVHEGNRGRGMPTGIRGNEQ